MIAPRIRPARRRDFAPMAAILGGWVDETPWMPRVHPPGSEPGFIRLLADKGELFAARSGLRLRGFLAREGDEVHALYLAPGARSQGLGAMLIDRAKEGRAQLSLWTFQANEGARRFYARQGFREVGLTDGAGNDEHLPDVRLVWTRPAGAEEVA